MRKRREETPDEQAPTGRTFVRKGHGAGAGVPRIEVPPPDELPGPVPDPRPPVASVARGKDGRLATSEAAAAIGALGGREKHKRVALARSLGLDGIEASPAFAPYKRSAAVFRRHHVQELARLAGGQCSTGPGSMVASASLQLAASRFLFAQAGQSGDPTTFRTASLLANDSRQSLLAAYSLAALEAQARKDTGNPFEALTNALGGGK